MINYKIQTAIDILTQVLKETASPEAVRFTFTVTNTENSVLFEYRNAKSLRDEGVAMKNIAGEWIK